MSPSPLTSSRRIVTNDIRRMHVHLLIAAAVLLAVEALGLFLGWDAITRIQPSWPQIYPYTVGGATLLLAAMALMRRGGRAATWSGIALAGITLLLGTGVDVAVGAGFLPSADPTSSENHAMWVALLPSLAAGATSAAVLLIPVQNPIVARIRFWVAAAAGVVSLLVVLSYVYGSVKLILGLGMTGTSLPAAVLGLLMVGAAMSARPDQPPLAILDARYDHGLMRRILPLLIVAPFVPAAIAWIVARIEQDSASAAAISELVTVVILVTVISLMGAGQSRARRELTMQRQRVWDAFEHTPGAIAVVTIDGRIATANVALSRLTGRSETDLVGSIVSDLVADPDHVKVAESLADVAAGREGFRRDVRFRGPTSVSTWVDMNLAPVRGSDGAVTYMVMQCMDLTERRSLQRVLADQSTTDPLTGLLNRSGLDREVDAIRRVPPAGHDVVVVYVDVDNLRALNETTGYEAGDDLLREVARRLRSSTRDEDIVARVSGDGFVIVATVDEKAASPDDVVVARLRRELTGPVAIGDGVLPLSVSLGASALSDSEDASDAVVRADRAMHADREERRRAWDRRFARDGDPQAGTPRSDPSGPDAP